jgi:hypothetical protein
VLGIYQGPDKNEFLIGFVNFVWKANDGVDTEKGMIEMPNSNPKETPVLSAVERG